MPTTWAEWKEKASILDNQWRHFQASQTRTTLAQPALFHPHHTPALAPPWMPAQAPPPSSAAEGCRLHASGTPRSKAMNLLQLWAARALLPQLLRAQSTENPSIRNRPLPLKRRAKVNDHGDPKDQGLLPSTTHYPPADPTTDDPPPSELPQDF